MEIFEDIRLTRDDLSPMMKDNAPVVARIIELCRKNCPINVLLWEIGDAGGIQNLTWDEVKQFLSDAKASGVLDNLSIAGDTLPPAITRPAAPSGIGCANGNVWVTPPAEPYTLRFYVNGVYKLTQVNYYITTLAYIDAVNGDVVQICEVEDGIVGWWARIVVHLAI